MFKLFQKSSNLKFCSKLNVSNISLIRNASSLVVAEISSGQITPGTLSTITAAKSLGNEVSLLIAGHNISDIGKKASSIKGISKVLLIDNEIFSNKIAENISKTLLQLANNYTHILAPSSNHGKNYLPRTAALLDSSPLTDVTSIIDNETFQRPQYAGNAIVTVKMTDKIKFLLVRSTAFEKTEIEGGNATIETLNIESNNLSASLSTFISENQTKSETKC